MRFFIAAFVLLTALAVVVFARIKYSAHRRPVNRPQKICPLPESARPILVLAGDSITQGTMSVDYTGMLNNRLGERWTVVNAGVNGDTSWGLLQRLEDVEVCDPDAIAILIGTNDAVATVEPLSRRMKKRVAKLPQTPGKANYRRNLKTIVERLQETTHAQIALCAPPPIGEDREGEAWRTSFWFARGVEEVASATGTTYLPLFESMGDALAGTAQGKTPPFEEMRQWLIRATLRRHVLGQSFDAIGELAGFSFHADHLHLNERGASMVADLVEDFLATCAVARNRQAYPPR